MNRFFLAENTFAFTVDSLLASITNNPALTQIGDQLMLLLNFWLGVDNPSLGTGLDGLQSGIHNNPFFDTLWGNWAQAIGVVHVGGLILP